MNKKGTESGDLQNIVVSLLVVCTVAVLATTYITQVGNKYSVTIQNSSTYASFQQFEQVDSNVQNLTEVFNNEQGKQTTVVDVISQMVQGAYSLIKLIFNLPVVANILIIQAGAAIGLPPIVVGLMEAMIIVIILFAALALVMKVRA